MPTFEITAPDGRVFEVVGPEGSTKEQALERVRAQVEAPSETPKRRETDRPGALAGGVNRGIAGLFGLPMDTVENVYNLGKAGVGTIAAAAGRPDLAPELTRGTPLSSEWIAQQMNKLGIGTANPNPEDRASQALYTVGNVVGGTAIPQPGPVLQSAGRALTTAAPIAVGAATAEQIDPRLTALGAMLPGAAAQVGREVSAGARNAVANRVNKALETPYAKQGLEAEEATGMHLSPGQITGKASINVAENAARQSFFTRTKVLESDQKVALQSIDHVNKLADKISVNPNNLATMGQELQSALTGTVKRIDVLRDKAASADYGAVRQAAGNAPIITYTNTVGALRKILDEYSGVAGADAEKITAQAQRALTRITEEAQPSLPPAGQVVTREQLREAQAAAAAGPQVVPKTVTVSEAMRTRRFYSKASAGAGNIFEDIAPNLNRELAGRLAKAVNDDFVAAEQSGQGPVASLLKQANKNYADHSASLEYVQTSVLGKLLGKDVADAALTGAVGNTVAGETVAQKMLKMHPSQAQTVSNILAQHAPNVLTDAKAFILRDALQKGMDVPVSAGANTIPISYAKFIKAMPTDEYLGAMRFSNAERRDIRVTIDAMTRAGDRTGYNQSQTAVISGLYNDMKAIASLGAKATLSVAGQAVGLNKIANAMASSEGRQALRTLVTPKQSETQVQNALAVINANQRQIENR